MNQFNLAKVRDLSELTNKALNVKLESIDPNLKKESISDKQILEIIELLSNELKIDLVTATIGIYLLFLKGAASSILCYLNLKR